jgi:prophage antirepressor-like protein
MLAEEARERQRKAGASHTGNQHTGIKMVLATKTQQAPNAPMKGRSAVQAAAITGASPFSFEGLDVRIIQIDGDPWFVAGDVCEALGLENSRQVVSRLDEDEKNTVHIADGNRGNPNQTIISEPGLYSLIGSSKKPEAQRFKRWVNHEVLPTIRKTGSYAGEGSQHFTNQRTRYAPGADFSTSPALPYPPNRHRGNMSDIGYHDRYRGPIKIPAHVAGTRNGCPWCSSPQFVQPGPCRSCRIYCADDMIRPAKGKRRRKITQEIDLLQVIEQETILFMPHVQAYP